MFDATLCLKYLFRFILFRTLINNNCNSFFVINVELFSFAHATRPFRDNFNNGHGTLTNIFDASTKNLTTSSILSSTYLIEILFTFLFEIPYAFGFLNLEYHNFFESLYLPPVSSH